MVVDERPREAFGVRGACSRFTTAPASWTDSKRFAQLGCGFAAMYLCPSPQTIARGSPGGDAEHPLFSETE
jgi:hypothetical protein